jgi:hypothetical protein
MLSTAFDKAPFLLTLPRLPSTSSSETSRPPSRFLLARRSMAFSLAFSFPIPTPHPDSDSLSFLAFLCLSLSFPVMPLPSVDHPLQPPSFLANHLVRPQDPTSPSDICITPANYLVTLLPSSPNHHVDFSNASSTLALAHAHSSPLIHLTPSCYPGPSIPHPPPNLSRLSISRQPQDPDLPGGFNLSDLRHFNPCTTSSCSAHQQDSVKVTYGHIAPSYTGPRHRPLPSCDNSCGYSCMLR